MRFIPFKEETHLKHRLCIYKGCKQNKQQCQESLVEVEVEVEDMEEVQLQFLDANSTSLTSNQALITGLSQAQNDCYATGTCALVGGRRHKYRRYKSSKSRRHKSRRHKSRKTRTRMTKK